MLDIVSDTVTACLGPRLRPFFHPDQPADPFPWGLSGLDFYFPAALGVESGSYPAEGNAQSFNSGTPQL